MNQNIIQFGRILTTLLVSVLLFVGTFFISNYSAIAKSLTPEAAAYEVNSADNREFVADPNKLGGRIDQSAKSNRDKLEDSQDNHQSLGENIREKFNLDEPIYPGTKKFINQVQDKADDLINDSDN